MSKHKISILWGSCPDDGQEAETYEFETYDELWAFQYGVDQANGWLEYEEVEEGYVHKWGTKLSHDKRGIGYR